MAAAKREKVVVRLTPLEADMLSSVADNGWGDGDFADWLCGTDGHGAKARSRVKACERAMEKLDQARQAQRESDGSVPKNEHR